MFSLNEHVIYGTTGVCRICDIVERTVCGRRGNFYMLKPVFENSATVYIPVDNENLTAKMRKIMSADEIFDLVKSISDLELKWIDDEHERKCEFARIIAQGDRRELIMMIKSIYMHRQELTAAKKKLHVSDENFMKEAEKMIYDEFAHVLNITRQQVVPFIAEQIEISKK